jgi:hypothetical protein
MMGGGGGGGLPIHSLFFTNLSPSHFKKLVAICSDVKIKMLQVYMHEYGF